MASRSRRGICRAVLRVARHVLILCCCAGCGCASAVVLVVRSAALRPSLFISSFFSPFLQEVFDCGEQEHSLMFHQSNMSGGGARRSLSLGRRLSRPRLSPVRAPRCRSRCSLLVAWRKGAFAWRSTILSLSFATSCKETTPREPFQHGAFAASRRSRYSDGWYRAAIIVVCGGSTAGARD